MHCTSNIIYHLTLYRVSTYFIHGVTLFNYVPSLSEYCTTINAGTVYVYVHRLLLKVIYTIDYSLSFDLISGVYIFDAWSSTVPSLSEYCRHCIRIRTQTIIESPLYMYYHSHGCIPTCIGICMAYR
jgi:hypothetical protein